MKPRPVLIRLILPFAVTIVLVVLACGIAFYYAGQRNVRLEQINDLNRLATLVRGQLSGDSLLLSALMDRNGPTTLGGSTIRQPSASRPVNTRLVAERVTGIEPALSAWESCNHKACRRRFRGLEWPAAAGWACSRTPVMDR